MLIQLLIFILLFCYGFVSINAVLTKISLGEKVALSFPFAFGLITILMLLFNLFSIEFTILRLLVSGLLITIFLWFGFLRKKNLSELINFDRKFFKKLLSVNLSWLFLFGVLVYLLFGITMKNLFWPTSAYDSVTGYDYMAKVISVEGKFNNSIFDSTLPTSSIRHSYPPFVSGSFSIPYMVGLNTSKVSVSILFLSLVLYFWSLFRRYTTETSAIFFVLLMVSIPEFLAMSALSLTNVPQSLFASAGIISIFEFISKKDKSFLILGSILLALNVWTRSDGIVFIFGGFIMLLFAFYKDKKINWLNTGLYFGITLLPFIVWQLFAKFKINNIYNNEDVFVKEIFFDLEKISALSELIYKVISNPQMYGIVFMLFAFVFILNLKFLFKHNLVLLLGLLSTFLIYSFLYYQMDNGGSEFNYTLSSMVSSSFKRGMFPFIPIMCFYMATSIGVNWFFTKIFQPLFK